MTHKLIILKNQFEQIGEATGNSKQPLIKQFAEGEDGGLFKITLDFVFNPFIVTGLAKKKMEKKLVPNTVLADSTLLTLMEYVKRNKSGSDTTVATVQGWIAAQPEETHQFLRNVFTKDIQIGISLKTINKVLGKNFIPEYSVQLAKKYEDSKHKIKGDFAVTLKLDGIRCTAVNDADGVKFFTRKGLPIEGLVELEEEFKMLPQGYVYDGELVHVENGMKSDELFRLTQKKVRKDGIKKDIRFIMFDILPKSEFLNGVSTEHWLERRKLMEFVLSTLDNKSLIEAVTLHYLGNDHDKIPGLLKEVMDKGYEGLMVNTTNGKYQTKRTDDLLKVKKMHSVDLKIIGFEEHSKKPGTLGALVVDYKGYKVNVGSGFDDNDRRSFWENRDQLLDIIVEVQYFEESKNQNGGLSLRFPVFLRLREDKNEVSYY